MSKNVEADGRSLKSLDVTCETSDKGVGRHKEVWCRKRQSEEERREERGPLITSIPDRYSETPDRQSVENGWCDDWEKLINCGEYWMSAKNNDKIEVRPSEQFQQKCKITNGNYGGWLAFEK
jgi:predicted ArsR family transcriptional regulator